MSKGRGFESQHRILDRHFCKIVMKINEKEAEDGPFKKRIVCVGARQWIRLCLPSCGPGSNP